MEDQQLYNHLDQQHFIVTKLQYQYAVHVSIVLCCLQIHLVKDHAFISDLQVFFLELLVPGLGSNVIKVERGSEWCKEWH